MRAYMTSFDYRLWVLFVGITISLAVILPLLRTGDGLVLVTIFILGVPHGALDIIMMKKLSLRGEGNQPPHQLLFGLYIAAYAVVFISGLLLWLIEPLWCLLLFLFLGTLHFSSDWVSLGRKKSYLVGLLVLTLPAMSHSKDLISYFLQLGVTSSQAGNIVFVMKLLGWTTLVALFLLLNLFNRLGLMWVSALVLAAAVLPILYYFCVYFCVLHAPLHTLSIKHQTQLSWKKMLQASSLPLSATVIAMTFFFYLLPQASLETQLLKTVFIGLFALTLPHLLLTVIWDAIRNNTKVNISTRT